MSDTIAELLRQIRIDMAAQDVLFEWWGAIDAALAAPRDAAQPPDLMVAVEHILDAGHMNHEDLARLRAAWEASTPRDAPR